MYVTHREDQAAQVIETMLAPLLGRDPNQLASQLPIGRPEHCIDLLNAYAAASTDRILLWPVADTIRQLEVFTEEVRPHIAHVTG